MGKKIIYGDDARALLLKGAREVFNAVKTTYGPKGGNVTIARDFGPPISTHDGVTVAMAIEFDNNEETFGFNVGAEMLKDASRNLNKTGDGTTSVNILTYAIMQRAFRLIAAGHNQMLIKREIEDIKEPLLAKLASLATPIGQDKARLTEIAAISAEDTTLGNIVGSAISQVGKDGIVTVDFSNDSDTTIEIANGYSFGSGYFSPLLITNPDKQEAVLEDVDVLIIDEAFESPNDLFVWLKKYTKANKDNLLIVCNDLKKEALAGVVYNKMKEIIKVAAVKTPGFGENKHMLTEDLAAVAGATIVSKGEIAKAGFEVLGHADKVIVTREKTSIIGEAGNITDRVKSLKSQKEHADSKFEEQRLADRIASLTGSVAVIKVGGENEAEVEEKKFRIDDAVSATRAAMSEGIVTGGGLTFLELSKADLPETMGWKIIREALRQPVVELMTNAGLNGEAIVAKLLECEKDFGINVMKSNDIVNLSEEGIIDPVLVIKEVIANAISIACLALITNAIVIEAPKKGD